jgi:serine/threonine-protein kinase
MNRKMKKMKGKAVLLVGAGLICILLLLNYVFMPLYVLSAEISVPDVKGLGQAEAFEKLESAGLNPVAGDTVFDGNSSKGLILRQRPFANDKVKSGRRVYLIVSGGKPMIETPLLVGKTIADAKFLIERSTLKLGEITFVPAEAPKGIVIKQSILSAFSVEKGTKISLSVSAGIEEGTIEVPSLVGLSETNAVQLLITKNLQAGKRNYQISPSILPGTVMEQYPLPGQKVNPQTKIDLFISKENIIINE